jgi:hypothetical protein
MVHGAAEMMVSRDTRPWARPRFPADFRGAARIRPARRRPDRRATLGQKWSSMGQASGGGGAGIEMYLTAGGSPNWMRISDCRHTSA